MHSKLTNSASFATELDALDELKSYRAEFLFPQHKGRNVLYFTGNSLGLQPRNARQALLTELEDWEKFGVEGHFMARNPWFSYHEAFKPLLAEVVGAKSQEVTAMGSLTANLHFLMVSFYRPKGKRFKILCESKAFPSDQYALETQVKFHGLDPNDAIIELNPRKGEHLIRQEDIEKVIEKEGKSIAMIMIGGVNYYSGQLFDMKKITKLGHDHGAIVGFDLAHAVGNVPLELHRWDVDFAAWCSYKYLNSGPGSVAGIFVHQKHLKDPNLPRFAGWWGNEPASRFKMKKGFNPSKDADSWQLSNAPVLSMAVHRESLKLFHRAGIQKLTEKSRSLTAYLEFVIQDVASRSPDIRLEIITPKNPEERGAQLSILAHGAGKELFDKLTASGVIADWREPNVIRLAPVPLYNSYSDIFEFGRVLEVALNSLA